MYLHLRLMHQDGHRQRIAVTGNTGKRHHHAAQDHLAEAQQRTGRTSILALARERERKTCRPHDGKRHNRHEQDRQRIPDGGSEQETCQQEDRSKERDPQRNLQELLIAHPSGKPRRYGTSHQQACADTAKDQAVRLSRNVVDILEDKGAASDIGKERPEEKELQQAVSQEITILQKLREFRKGQADAVQAF